MAESSHLPRQRNSNDQQPFYFARYVAPKQPQQFVDCRDEGGREEDSESDVR